MKKAESRAMARSVIRRMINPAHVARAAKLQLQRKSSQRSHDDAQLKLYAQILPSDFLHYGFFDDPDCAPEDISLRQITDAQNRYAELVLEQVVGRDAPVLDVGCGMGGLARMLGERGYETAALTPNRTQAAHAREALPGAQVLECKLEDLAAADHRHRFGTVITAESLQYLKLDRALPVIEEVLRPGGRWVACDYFRLHAAAHEKSGHAWPEFVDLIRSRGWRISLERDITAHVLPTLRCIHMWASRLGPPVIEFIASRLRRKQPALHYMLEEALELGLKSARENIEIVNPETFSRQKKYLLLVLERSSEGT